MATKVQFPARISGEKVWKGALAGIVAGIAASFVMDKFQAAILTASPSDSDAEPATEKAANKIAKAATGHAIPAQDKPFAGQAVHYGLGIALGAAYGIAAEFRPSVTAGFGTAFSSATTALLDETAVPAAGLGAAPWKTSPSTHLYTMTSHLVFGTVTEATRRLVRKALG